jgi:hypothetical protein
MLTIPFDEYAAMEGANWSKVKRIWQKSPLHYKAALESEEDEDTVGRAMGREVHRLVLEPDTEPDYVLWKGGDRRGKEWNEFKAANEGKTIFKPNEVNAVYLQAQAIVKHPVAMSYLRGATFEQTLQWVNAPTGLKCKGRTDAQKPGILIDLKGCGSVVARDFAREAAKNGYHLQLAHYIDGIKTITGIPPAKVIIIAVETKAPYDVAVYEIPREPLQQAAEELAYALETLAKCIKTDIWPGVCPEEQELIFPQYIYGDGEISIKVE